MDIQPHVERRRRLAASLAAAGGGVAILPTGSEVIRNRDNEYPYRADSSFAYLTGFPEPEAVLVMVVTGEAARSLLFCRPKDPDREIWDGYRYGPEAAREVFGFDEADDIAALDTRLPELLVDAPAVYAPIGAHHGFDARLQRWMGGTPALLRAGRRLPRALSDLRVFVDEMRLVKDASELATLRRAAAISAAAHERAMRTARPGLAEYHVEAELLHAFRHGGAQSVAYNSIVATGANACVLHYRAGDAVLADGDLVLIDAGCELDNYASDITRTFPANGRFSPEQRALYEIVLEAQRAAIEAVGPGAGWNAPHEAAVRVLAQGLVDLGLLEGSAEAVIEKEAYRQFYMHRTGHWLGLDVHDVGDYRDPTTQGENRPWRALVPGMVLTVEPGLYVRPASNVPERFWNLGIRIEDDVAVTASGCDVLTAAAPKRLDEIEALMRDR